MFMVEAACDCENQRLNRQHYRGIVKVQVVDTADDELDKLACFARVIEASPTELVLACQPCLSGCGIIFWIAPSEVHPRLFLEGRVTWARRSKGLCHHGIQIINNRKTDVAKWVSLMKSPT